MKIQGFSRCILFAACLASTCSGVKAFAQTSTATPAATPTTATREVILTFTSKSFQDIVQSLGFETTRTKDDKGQEATYFSFRAQGYKVAAIVDRGFLQLYLGFNDVKPTLAGVNEWNAKHSLTRAYADKDGTASLESDLFTQGGVTRDTVEAFIKNFRDIVSVWSEYAQAHQS